MNRKRFIGYLLDIIFLSVITAFIYMAIPQNQSINNLEKQLETANDSFFKEEIKFNTYLNQFSDINLDLAKAKVVYTIADLAFIVIWFIGIPLNNKGQTIGQSLLKVKTKRDDGGNLTFNDLFFRSLIVNGLGTTIISLGLLYLLNSKNYFLASSVLGIIQSMIALISCVMIVNSEKGIGIQDKISKTHIEEV